MERQHIRYRSVTPPEFSLGDAFIQGLRYRLPLPVVHRSFGAYNPNNLIPNSRINCLITHEEWYAS